MPYLLNTPEDRAAMLERIGVSSIDDLFAPIPAELRLGRPLDIPPAMPEMELTRHMFLSEGVSGVVYLLSGVVFPIGVLPSWIQALSLTLPTTYWLEGMRRALMSR